VRAEVDWRQMEREVTRQVLAARQIVRSGPMSHEEAKQIRIAKLDAKFQMATLYFDRFWEKTVSKLQVRSPRVWEGNLTRSQHENLWYLPCEPWPKCQECGKRWAMPEDPALADRLCRACAPPTAASE
jgi:hypothetical protein